MATPVPPSILANVPLFLESMQSYIDQYNPTDDTPLTVEEKETVAGMLSILDTCTRDDASGCRIIAAVMTTFLEQYKELFNELSKQCCAEKDCCKDTTCGVDCCIDTKCGDECCPPSDATPL